MLVMIAGVPIRFKLTSADFDPVEGISAETSSRRWRCSTIY